MGKQTEKLTVPFAGMTAFVEEELTDSLLTVENSGERHYGFRIGKLGLLVLRDSHSECLKNQRIYPVPKTHPWFQGMINLRGDLIPVFDIDRLVVSGNEDASTPIILVLDTGKNAGGILVRDYPCAVDNLQPLSPKPSVPELFETHCLNAYTEEGRVWLELNHRSFFDSLAKKIPIAGSAINE